MLGAEVIAKTLKSAGVRVVYLYPGGTIAPVLDALVKEGIGYVCARNEQGAGYAAIGAAKYTGEPQVVMVTSGPGVTNLLTPVADAYYDSVPLLALTGQVGTGDINYKKLIRQTGFQETDTVGIFAPVTKHAHILTGADDISTIVRDAFTLTKSGRQGPVLLDMPMNVQRSEANRGLCQPQPAAPAGSSADPATLRQIAGMIADAKRPLVLAGNGVYLSGAVSELRRFADHTGLPVISSQPGVGAMPSRHERYFGFLGHTGEFYANLAAFNCDLLLVLGARLDLRQTGSELPDLVKGKKIVRVDIDPSELEYGRVKADLNVRADLKEFLKAVTPLVQYKSCEEWLGKIRAWKTGYDSSKFFEKMKLSMYDVIRAVDEKTKDRDVIVTSGVGTHQQMVPRYFSFDYPSRRWMTSAGHGTMGFDLPACMGAVMASGGKATGIVFAGDGSIQMNIQELATVREFDLPLKIFVLDNGRLGIVSQFQLLNWKSDPSTGNKKNPSFASIGKAYGLKGFDIASKEEIAPVMEAVFADDEPSIVHCHVDAACGDTLPMLLAGQKMNEMYPYGKDES